MDYYPEVFLLISEHLPDKRDQLCLGFTCKTAYYAILGSKKGGKLLRFSKCLNNKGILDCCLVKDKYGGKFCEIAYVVMLDITEIINPEEKGEYILKLFKYAIEEECREYIEYSTQLRDIYRMFKLKLFELKNSIKELEQFKWFYESEI